MLKKLITIINEIKGRIADKRAKTMADIVRPYICGSTLDIGCGDTRIIASLKGLSSVIGTDIYKPTNPLAPFVLASGEQLPFKNKSFDTALCVSVLHHCQNPQRALREMRRVAKRLVIIEDKYDNWPDWICVISLHIYLKIFFGIDFRVSGFHSLTEWRSLFAQEGLTIKTQTMPQKPGSAWLTFKNCLFVLEDTTSASPEAKKS